jgi:hypothetical protein
LLIGKLSAIMLYMVLATIMQCAIICATTPQPNAADAWRDLAKQFENIYIPQGGQNKWTPELQAQYESLAPLIAQVREITRMEHCDWEIDYSEGPMVQLTHLSTTRDGMHLIQFSIQGDINNGKIGEALQGVHAIAEMSVQGDQGESAIGSLVAASNFAAVRESTSIIDKINDPVRIGALLETVQGMDEFDPFGIRKSLSSERDIMVEWLRSPNVDVSLIGMDETFNDEDISQYAKAMTTVSEIFQIEDKQEALTAMKNWDLALESGEMGVLAAELSPVSMLLVTAFDSAELVATFKQLLQDKITMLRTANSANHFLQAVDAYNALDSEERAKAIEQGDFTVVEEPLLLFAKACSMPVTQITLSENPETPSWVAPLYSLALDCIARGTHDDTKCVAAFISHMSMQNRFAASIIAGKLFAMLPWNAFTFDIEKVPVADAFSLHGSARSDRERLREYFEIDEKWSPSNANVLAMSLTLANEKSVPDANPLAWRTLVEAMKIPDDDSIVEAVLEEWMPESLTDFELKQEPAFNEMLKELKTNLAKIVRAIRSKGRE